MGFHSVSRTFLSASVLAVITTGAMADTVIDKGMTFSLGGAYNNFDSKRKLDDSWAPEIGLGYRFNDRFSLEAVYSDYGTDQKAGGEAKIKDYRLDAFYDMTPWDGSWTPYAVMGIGHFDENREFTSNREDTRLSLGGGLRKAMTPNLSVSADLRAVRSLDYDQTESMAKVALTWTFGSVAEPAPEPEPVPSKVMPADSDMDGVADTKDLCPNSPADAQVDKTGCPPLAPINLQVGFGFDSAVIQENYYPLIKKMGDYLNRYPEAHLRVVGHTDNQGSALYNEGLSLRRAEAVSDVLKNNYGISAERLEAVGKGSSEPLASNDTAEGRQKNRRVEGELLK